MRFKTASDKLFYMIVWTVILTMIPFVFAGCNDDDLRKAATAADRIELAITGAADLRQELTAAEYLDREESILFVETLVELTRATIEFNSRARAYARTSKTIEGETRTELLRLFSDILSAADALAITTERIKNETARVRIRAVLQTINSALNVIKPLIEKRVATKGEIHGNDKTVIYHRQNLSQPAFS